MRRQPGTNEMNTCANNSRKKTIPAATGDIVAVAPNAWKTENHPDVWPSNITDWMRVAIDYHENVSKLGNYLRLTTPPDMNPSIFTAITLALRRWKRVDAPAIINVFPASWIRFCWTILVPWVLLWSLYYPLAVYTKPSIINQPPAWEIWPFCDIPNQKRKISFGESLERKLWDDKVEIAKSTPNKLLEYVLDSYLQNFKISG